jgi:hypothetical protein
MGVTEFEKEKVFAPFMGSPLDFIPGQDPLGLLNLGENIFNILLSGLNNVTERIRYYSFYCWIFDKYAQEVRITSKNEQYKFLRRAEYILALIAAKKDLQGIAGITKAIEMYKKGGEIFSLEEGTGELTGTTENSYWKNARGIFGQNYVSSMVQMGLIKQRAEGDGTYIRTDFAVDGRISGYQLAKAFEDNVGKEMAYLFTQCVVSGNISDVQLDQLTDSFTMRSVPDLSEENTLLWDLLTGPDDPFSNFATYFRKRTIQLLLQKTIHSSTSITVLSFVFDAYYEKGKVNNVPDPTYTLWYYFQLEQFWHIVCTGSLQGFLIYLNQTSDGAWVNENDVIKKLSTEVAKILKEHIDSQFEIQFDQIVINENLEHDIAQEIQQSKSPANKIAKSVVLLRKLLSENKQYMDDLRQFSKKYDIISNSSFISSIDDLVKHKEDDIQDFIIFFLNKYVVFRHQYVALRKMNNTQSTEKFIKEDGMIRFISTIDFGYSAPRIGTILSFLEELQIFNEGNMELTKSGMDRLKQMEL